MDALISVYDVRDRCVIIPNNYANKKKNKLGTENWVVEIATIIPKKNFC
jgi:hypothetical protein